MPPPQGQAKTGTVTKTHARLHHTYTTPLVFYMPLALPGVKFCR